MSVFVVVARGRRRFLCDESGSAHIEWTVAVALVLLAAITIMSMVGKGSETRSGDIAISITDADLHIDVPPDEDTGKAPAFGPEEVVTPSGDAKVIKASSTGFGPGADLGIGFTAGVDIRAGDYRRISARRTETLNSKLDDLRRDTPAHPARLTVPSSRLVAADSAAPEKAGILLPSLPVWRMGFAETACLDPLDHDSITDARFDLTEIVASGR